MQPEALSPVRNQIEHGLSRLWLKGLDADDVANLAGAETFKGARQHPGVGMRNEDDIAARHAAQGGSGGINVIAQPETAGALGRVRSECRQIRGDDAMASAGKPGS